MRIDGDRAVPREGVESWGVEPLVVSDVCEARRTGEDVFSSLE